MEDLVAVENLRQRYDPRPGDPDYLCLSDLLKAIRSLIPPNVSSVLDYGCGNSPYRALFGNCNYHRADLTGGSNLDFECAADARLPTEVGGYDCVLSTQVLEHVEDPAAYLRECYRILNPGGHLLLTTHGTFEDHAWPHDYWRWTAFGLRRIVEQAGLTIKVGKKFTTGPRCIVSLNEDQFYKMRFRKSGLYGQALSLGVRAVQRLGARRLHIASDNSFREYSVVDWDVPGHDIYIGLALLAIR